MSKSIQDYTQNSDRVNGIYKTNQYDLFSYDDRNRPVDPRRVRALVKSMREIGFINQPIKVSKAGIILDGQHRFEAAREVGVPLLFFVDYSKGDNYKKMSTSNRLGKMWTKQDHIHGLAKVGLKPYVLLSKFQTEFPEIKMTEQMMLLQNNTCTMNKDDFGDGKWKHGDLNKGRMWGNQIMELKTFYPDFNKSIFIRSMIEIFNKHPEFTWNEFMKKVRLRPAMLYPCGDRRQYKMMIEKIYNHHRRNSDKIRLDF